MAARATRSTSGAASSSDDASRCLLLALSHDELGVIVDGLADPLEPVVAVAFSSTCLGLRTPLGAALEVLRERHARAVALCSKLQLARSQLRDSETSCAKLRDVAVQLLWDNKGLTAADMATLGMILRTNGLPRLQRLHLHCNGERERQEWSLPSGFGDAGVQALCDGLGRGAAPALRVLCLSHNKFGPVGAESLAAALRRGAMPKLAALYIDGNPIGNQGVAALAEPLRKLPALQRLSLDWCGIGDEGVTSLVADLGKDDFQVLEFLDLAKYDSKNLLTDKAFATLASALNEGSMPKLTELYVRNYFDDAPPDDALAQAAARRGITLGVAEEEYE